MSPKSVVKRMRASAASRSSSVTLVERTARSREPVMRFMPASADDIDTGMVEGCNHPMGPLRLADLIGLVTTLAVGESLYAEFKEPLYAAPPLLQRMVDAGRLGRKSGSGFYPYS